MNAKARIHRILKRLELYSEKHTKVETSCGAEELTGVYYNEGGSPPEIGVSERGLALEGRFIPYSEISSIKGPRSKAERGIELNLISGEWLSLVFPSGDRTSDVFEWVRFLDRVMSDKGSD